MEIPEQLNKQEKNLSRRLIVTLYSELQENDQRSRFYLVKKICYKLGYVVDDNGSNSYVLKVLREHFDCNAQ